MTMLNYKCKCHHVNSLLLLDSITIEILKIYQSSICWCCPEKNARTLLRIMLLIQTNSIIPTFVHRSNYSSNSYNFNHDTIIKNTIFLIKLHMLTDKQLKTQINVKN